MTSWDFAPTHVVPGSGLPAWESPDVSRPTVPLDPLLPVQLLERRGDWSRILCSNGWSAWVDGRLLVTVPAEPPAAERSMGAIGDPRPLLARVEDSLGRYRRAAEDLAGGRTDGEGFRRRTRGLRVGMVVDGESVWLYDAEHERWVHCDGAGLTTLAASSPPSLAGVPEEGAAGAPGPAARGGTPPGGPGGTRLVDPDSLPPYAGEEAADRGGDGPAHGAEPEAPSPGEAPAPPEPTRLVAPAPEGPPADSAGKARAGGAAGPAAPADGSPAAPPPTRLADAPAEPGTGADADAARPDATRLAGPAPEAPPPTRLAGAPGEPGPPVDSPPPGPDTGPDTGQAEGARAQEEREATRVVPERAASPRTGGEG
ncbi:hypothetical protein NPS70_09705 [Streptomyces sp. C10-9-1]|uniref:hypothetical protein n=1 Tax=Streptomyces sp. C10-9-1 TaxID=1859285 RepID=UPI002111AB9D|nr:hypothetical protein [Streptomyces sp. C10-9-1]MCQ6553468.1 hypothetical protein [Streptomyces sp. C10-9-1]